MANGNTRKKIKNKVYEDGKRKTAVKLTIVILIFTNLISLSSIFVPSFHKFIDDNLYKNNETVDPIYDNEDSDEEKEAYANNPTDSDDTPDATDTTKGDSEATPDEIAQKNAHFSASITSIATADLVLRIRTSINKLGATGTCTLTIGDYTETVKIAADPQSSTCEGFDVDASKLIKGKQAIHILIKTDNYGDLELIDTADL
jgi:hypothetical protein